MRLDKECRLLTSLHFSVPLRLCASALILATLCLTFTVTFAEELNHSPVDLVLGPNDAGKTRRIDFACQNSGPSAFDEITLNGCYSAG